MPAFRLVGRAGVISSRSVFGRETAVLFVKPGCPFCERQYPLVADAVAAVGRNVAFIPVSEGRPGGEFAACYQDTSRLAQALGVRSVPTLLLVSRAGRIQYVQTGERDLQSERLLLRRFAAGLSLGPGSIGATMPRCGNCEVR